MGRRLSLPRLKRVARAASVAWYYRAPGGTLTRLCGDPHTDQRAHAEWLAADAGPAAPTPRSMAALADAYERDAAYRKLAPITRDTRRRMVAAILATTLKGEPHAGRSVAGLRARHIEADLAGLPRGVARNRWKAWRALLGCAQRLGWVETDVSRDVRGPSKAAQPHRAWTRQDVARFRARWPIGTQQRLALEVLYDLAPRRADLVAMGDLTIRSDGRASWRQSKTGEWTTPVTPGPEMLAALAAWRDARPGHALWMATATGAPRSAAGFGNWFRDACATAGLNGLSAHGLRHTLGADAASAGDAAINAVLGHDSASGEAATYRQQAEAIRLAEEARRAVRRARLERPARKVGTGVGTPGRAGD